MNCPTCMANVAEGAVFCPQCGARLAGRATGKTAAPDAPPPARPAPDAGERSGAAGLRPGGRDVVEEELWHGGYSPKAMYGYWIVAVLATVAGLIALVVLQSDALGWSIFGAAVAVVWGGLLLTLAYRRLSVKYRLTNQRLFHEEGILRRVTDRIEIIDIDDVAFEQGILERLFNVGTIHVSSTDRTHPDLWLPGIDDVKWVADTIDQARRAERHRRAVYIESV